MPEGTVTWRLKAGIVEAEETSIAWQWLGKHGPGVTNTQATIEELLDTVFSVGSAPRLYDQDPRPAEGIKTLMWAVVTVVFAVIHWDSYNYCVKIRYQETSGEDRRLYVCCSYSDIWGVWFSETVIVACGGDP
jgi:hypothetical protein